MDGPIHIPIDRAAAWNRAGWLIAVAAILVFPTWLVFPRLQLVPNAVSNRLGEYAIALILITGDLLAVLFLLQSFRWIKLAVSRAADGFRIDNKGISARLGTFGVHACSWRELAIEWPEYLFTLDLSPDAALPMRESPAVQFPDGGRLDLLLRRFSAWKEEQWWPPLEERLRPMLFADPRWE